MFPSKNITHIKWKEITILENTAFTNEIYYLHLIYALLFYLANSVCKVHHMSHLFQVIQSLL